jgi:hypothetical protein
VLPAPGPSYEGEVLLDRNPQAAACKSDDDHPSYTVRRVAQILGAIPGFLRSLDERRIVILDDCGRSSSVWHRHVMG